MVDAAEAANGDRDLQRERSAAEIDKLKAEAESLRQGGKWSPTIWVALIAGIGGLGAIVTAIPTAIIQWKISEYTVLDEKNKADLKLIEARNEATSAGEEKLATEKELNKVLESKSAAETSLQEIKLELAATLQKVAAAKAQLVTTVQNQQTALTEVAALPLPPAAARSISEIADKLGAAAQTATNQSRLVYLQFQGAIDRQTMRNLQGQLTSAGFLVPGVERVATPFSSSVKYFRPDDIGVAKSIAGEVNKFLSATCTNWPKPISPVPVSDQPDQRQIEVWISGTCRPVDQAGQ